MSNEVIAQQNLSTAVAVHLFGMGYEAERSPDLRSYRFHIQVEPGKRRETVIVVHEEERVIRMYVELPIPEAVRRWTWIAELVQAANEELAVFGFFVLSADGRLSYRLADEYPNAAVSQDTIEGFLDRAAFPIRVFDRALRHAKRGGMSPRTALQLGLTGGNAMDTSACSPHIRRGMLELLP